MSKMDPEKLRLLEETLSYWKAHISIQDVLAEELAYSLIYDNILPEKLGDALSTAGLDALPNRFFLIQVDDYLNHSSKLRMTQEFFQKPTLVNLLWSYMRENGIGGFAANLVGMDKVICFLCCPEPEDGSIAGLLEIAAAFKEHIRTRSAYTISICISDRCARTSQYSEMYPRMDLALSKSYFSGKEFTILMRDMPLRAEPAAQSADLNAFYPELLVSIVRRNRELFERVLQEMLQSLLSSQSSPRKAHLQIIRLLQRVEDYCHRSDVPEPWIQTIHEEVMHKILTCNFMADVRVHLNNYYEQLTQVLGEHSPSGEYTFKLLVEEYIAAHHHETIRLGALASVIGFSEGHFARMFRQEFGMTFVQYLSGYRIEQSKQLLAQTDIPIEQIAYRVGINNYSYFCTCFKQTVGLSPGGYRRRMAAHRQHSREQEAAPPTESPDF